MPNSNRRNSDSPPGSYVRVTYYTAGDSGRRSRVVPITAPDPDQITAVLAAALDRDEATVFVEDWEPDDTAERLARTRDRWRLAQELEAAIAAEVRTITVEAISAGVVSQVEAHEITGVSRTTIGVWLSQPSE